MTQEQRSASVDVHHHGAQLSPSILMQLAFTHMLVVLGVTLQLKRLLPALAQSAPVLPPKKNVALKRAVQTLLEELIAPFDDRLVDHPWSPPRGVLSKVRRDAFRLSAELSESEEAFAWWEMVEEAWRAAMVASESLAHAPLMKFVKLLDRSALHMLTLITIFRTDENVLFCLLRHHAALDECLGDGYTCELLQQLHVRGLPGLETHMTKRYRRRGFNELLPQISHTMAEISGQAVGVT